MSTHIPADELSRYADVIVQVGLGLRQGQRLLVRADLQTAALVRAVARSAYRAGARLVDVVWGDEQLTLVRLQEAPRDSFGEVPAWYPAVTADYLRAGDALLSVYAATPTLLAGQDHDAVSTMMRATAEAARPVTELVQRNASTWAVVSYPTPGWAAQVLPDVPEDERAATLWRAIAITCRLDAPDPVAAWQAHVADLDARCAYMNARRYTALRFSAPGTDLTVGLADGHLWAGGGSVSERGQAFVPNLPTEEIFSLPHRGRVDGVVRSSRPLNYGGNLIEDFTLTFEAGRVVAATAARGEEVLRRLIDTDEGSAHLGEVALVTASSPVARTGMLFANTLYDENAASHLALGSGYRFCVEGGAAMTPEQFEAAGGNLSATHVDFMIGSGLMDIDGLTADGAAEPVMRAGEWAFVLTI
ncbi:MAG: aminopeptidase [Chloroflexales bacterium]|nr:aminopeptidase [Chloroflexales bacterium]